MGIVGSVWRERQAKKEEEGGSEGGGGKKGWSSRDQVVGLAVAAERRLQKAFAGGAQFGAQSFYSSKRGIRCPIGAVQKLVGNRNTAVHYRYSGITENSRII